MRQRSKDDEFPAGTSAAAWRLGTQELIYSNRTRGHWITVQDFDVHSLYRRTLLFWSGGAVLMEIRFHRLIAPESLESLSEAAVEMFISVDSPPPPRMFEKF